MQESIFFWGGGHDKYKYAKNSFILHIYDFYKVGVLCFPGVINHKEKKINELLARRAVLVSLKSKIAK